MLSYFRTQWLSILVGLGSLGMSIYNAFKANEWLAIGWLATAVVWLIMSRIWYDHDRIKLLELKAKKYEALCKEVDALYKANQVDHIYIDKLHRELTYLTFIVEERKK